MKKFFSLEHKDAVYPARATKGSAGYDITAVDSGTYDESKDVIIYDTGVTLKDIPDNCYVALYPRSSIFKTHLRLANSVGVIDSDYKDTIKVIFDVRKSDMMSAGDITKYVKGDRIAQLVVHKYEKEGELVVNKRKGGLGSTGNKKLKLKEKKK